MNQLPEGWGLVRISDLGEIRLGKMLDKAKNKGQPVKYLRNINVRWFEFDLSDTLTMLASPDEREQLLVRDGDLFICEGGEPGRCAVWRQGENAFVYQKALHRIRTTPAVVPEFLMYRLRHDAESGRLQDAFTGTTIKHLTRESLSNYLISLPPIDEQQRIVAKLKPLLDSVNAYQQRLVKIPVILKRFRQAVLAAACSGKLTVNWREENGLTGSSEEADFPPEWKHTDLGKVVRVKAGEAFKKSEYSEAGARLLQIANVSFSQIIWEQENYLPISYLEKYPDLVLTEGDILMALNRPILNWGLKVARVGKNDLPAVLYQRVGKFILLDEEAVFSDYLYLFFQSFEFVTAISDRLRGSDQPYVNPSEMYDIKVPLPPFAEQNEIARRVETLFKLVDQIEARYQRAKTQVDKMQQSILAKAFRGELVPTEAELARREGRDYEPASVLLERIRSERAEHANGRKEKARSQPSRARLAHGAKPRV